MAHCFYKNCSFKAMYLCSCSGLLPICYMHLAAHKTSEIPNPHEILYLFLAEYKETKIFIIDLINNHIVMLWNSYIKGTIMISDKIKELNEKLSKNIQAINNEEFLLSDAKENKEEYIRELDEFKKSQIISNGKEIINLEKALSEYCRDVYEKIGICYDWAREIILIDKIPYENQSIFQSILLEDKEKAAEMIKNEISNKNLNANKELSNFFPRVSITTETEIVEKLKNKISEISCFENQLEDLSKRTQALFTMSFTSEYKQIVVEIEQVKRRIANKFRVFSFICKNDEYFKLLNESNKDFKKIYNDYIKKNYSISKLCESLLKTINENQKNFLCFEKTSLYLIDTEKNQTKIFIYNTKTRKKDEKIIASPIALTRQTCIVQISNSELFLFGSFPPSGAAFIFDTKNYIVKSELPEGIPCSSASGIYYNNSVYIFGGLDTNSTPLNLSEKYDFLQNSWSKFTSLPIAPTTCSCIIFKKNILLAGINLSKIYSLDTENYFYSEISSIDLSEESQKILISGNSRAYILECLGKIYESEIGDKNSWKAIGKCTIEGFEQTFRIFSKECIFIGAIQLGILPFCYCFKFSLADKKLKLENKYAIK